MNALHRLVLALLLVVPPTAVLAAADGSATSLQAPPGDGIVEITGDAASVFQQPQQA